MTRRIVHGRVPAVLASVAGVAVALGATGCGTATSESALEHNKQLVRQMNAEVWNEGNLDHVEDLFAADFVLHFLPDGSETRGIDGLREHVLELREAFPDWSESIQRIVAEGDVVVIHYISGGTNQGQWQGNPPTGRRVHLNEISIFRVEDGRIAEQWLLPDISTMQQQLQEVR